MAKEPQYRVFPQMKGWKVISYENGPSFPVESKWTADKAEAEGWAEKANKGETVPEAGFASYCDD